MCETDGHDEASRFNWEFASKTSVHGSAEGLCDGGEEEKDEDGVPRVLGEGRAGVEGLRMRVTALLGNPCCRCR